MSKCLRLKNMNSKSNKIFSSQDALQVAKQRLPGLIFDFIEGATGREVSALRNMTRFDEITLQPRVIKPWLKPLKRSTSPCAFHQRLLVQSKTCARGPVKIVGFNFTLVAPWRSH
jgi:hypothetical protein